MGLCYDIEGNSVDCASSDSIGYSSGVAPTDQTAGLDFTSHPVATLATDSQNNGGSALSSFFGALPGIITSVDKAVVGQGTSSGLRLQLNPATGQQQYYNPATGMYVGGPIGGSSLFGGASSSSFFLILFALVVAFFAFGGRKRLAA